MGKKYFFGWTNIKWFVREIVKVFSNEPSYFSQKRVHNTIAFLSATGIILCFVWTHRATIQNSEILADAALLFTIAGYTVNHIQKEKALQASADNDAPDKPETGANT